MCPTDEIAGASRSLQAARKIVCCQSVNQLETMSAYFP
jgi:hypothetical protein